MELRGLCLQVIARVGLASAVSRRLHGCSQPKANVSLCAGRLSSQATCGVYPRDDIAWVVVRAVTPESELQIKLAVTSCHSTLDTGRTSPGTGQICDELPVSRPWQGVPNLGPAVVGCPERGCLTSGQLQWVALRGGA